MKSLLEQTIEAMSPEQRRGYLVELERTGSDPWSDLERRRDELVKQANEVGAPEAASRISAMAPWEIKREFPTAIELETSDVRTARLIETERAQTPEARSRYLDHLERQLHHPPYPKEETDHAA